MVTSAEGINVGFMEAGSAQERVQDFHKQQLHNSLRLEALTSEKIMPGSVHFLDFEDPRHPAVTERSACSVMILLLDLCIQCDYC